MYSDGNITYYISGSVCIIEYEDYTVVNLEVAERIIEYKKKVKEQFPHVNKFIGVLNETIKTDVGIMKMFSTKEALDGVDFVGVVFVSSRRIQMTLYKLGKWSLNLLCWALVKKPMFMFFSDRIKALNWINSK